MATHFTQHCSFPPDDRIPHFDVEPDGQISHFPVDPEEGSVADLADLCCVQVGLILVDFSVGHAKGTLPTELSSEERDEEIRRYASELPSPVLQRLTAFCSLRTLEALHPLLEERRVNAEPAWARAVEIRWSQKGEKLAEPSAIEKFG